MSPASTRAWLLEFGGDRMAAVGLHELIEVLSRPRRFHIPMAGPMCHEVLVWRDEILPVVDLRRSHGELGAMPAASASVTAIAAYQLAPGQRLRHGALELSAMPRTVSVGDDQACPLPEGRDPLFSLALAGFSYQNLAVPIIDVARVFEGDVV